MWSNITLPTKSCNSNLSNISKQYGEADESIKFMMPHQDKEYSEHTEESAAIVAAPRNFPCSAQNSIEYHLYDEIL